MKLEADINARLKTTHADEDPRGRSFATSRDELLQRADAGQRATSSPPASRSRRSAPSWSISPIRRARSNVNEIVVTGPGAPAIAERGRSLRQAGRASARRAFSSRASRAEREVQAAGQGAGHHQDRAAARSRTRTSSRWSTPGSLQVDHRRRLPWPTFWKQILPDITLHDNVHVREEGSLAWAVRKNSPKLMAELNPFIKANGLGTLFGNMLLTEIPARARSS